MSRFSKAAWLQGTILAESGHTTFIPWMSITDGTGTILGTAGNPLNVTGGGSATQNVQGTQARAAAITANPVLVGGRGNSVAPTAVTNGQLVDNWLGTSGQTIIGTGGGTTTPVAVFTAANMVSAQDGAARPNTSFIFASDGVSSIVPIRGDANALAMQPALSANFWAYAAAASGIVNTTTAVTIKAAAGASVRNYIESLQLNWEALGAATEVVIRDGAGGTVLWRFKIGTGAAGNLAFNFRPALKGTANTLMEVATLTASVTGAVYVNAQGWTGT